MEKIKELITNNQWKNDYYIFITLILISEYESYMGRCN